eukprot:10114-Heterococcus_DN1.PRE.1
MPIVVFALYNVLRAYRSEAQAYEQIGAPFNVYRSCTKVRSRKQAVAPSAHAVHSRMDCAHALKHALCDTAAPQRYAQR